MRTTRLVLGIDPGDQETGLVLRRGNELIAHELIVRGRSRGMRPDVEYIGRVGDAAANIIPCDDRGLEYERLLVAVEAVNEPTGFADGERRPISLGGLIGTSGVAAAMAYFYEINGDCDLVIVEPAKHGAGPIRAYPVPLQPTRGKGAGFDKLRHCRSAWDIAGAGGDAVRLQERRAR